MYIQFVGYTVGNHAIKLRWCVSIKLNFRTYLQPYASLNEHFELRYLLIETFIFAHRFLLNQVHTTLSYVSCMNVMFFRSYQQYSFIDLPG